MNLEIQINEQKIVKVFLTSIESLTRILKKEMLNNKIITVTHKNLWKLYHKKFETLNIHKTIFLPEGEQIKNISYLSFLYTKFLELHIDRQSVIIIFGGGVLGDLCGFAAATFMRGIPYVQIPTTLVAMVDSSIGGKTAINFYKGKNIVGNFYQPRIILCDLLLLKTLPQKELYNGFAEILKYAILNKKIFNMLETNKTEFLSFIMKKSQSKFVKDLILSCIKTKLEIVQQDEKELTGLREKLNLGHTIAHAIESVTKYKIYSHGECVILGLVAESYLAAKLKILPWYKFIKILDLVDFYTKNMRFNKKIVSIKPQQIYFHLQYDKKVRNENIRFVLPKDIGMTKTVSNVPKEVVIDAIKYLFNWINSKA